MKLLLRALAVVGLLLAAFIAVSAYFFLTAEPVPAVARFRIDLDALRAAAGPAEALPERVRAEEVARAEIPALGAVVGGGLSNYTFAFYCWQFVYADGSTAIVDAVHTSAMQAAQYGDAPYSKEAWERQVRALSAARVIAVTHEHHDHIGGIADSPAFAALVPHLKLTAAQLQPPPFGGVGHPIQAAAALESGPEGSIHPIAPGLVAITAAGHTPGSQMVYARLKGGQELLLIGDIAWHHHALERVRTRPRLTSKVMGEDAVAVTHQLRAILDFHKANPQVDVVISHDLGEMEQRFSAGKVLRGLQ